MKKQEILDILDETSRSIDEILKEYPEASGNAYIQHIRKLIEATGTMALTAAMALSTVDARKLK